MRQAHENGDAESSHGHFKTAVDQALLLRGSREFASREEYAKFLQQIVATRNAGRTDRFSEESAALRDLPDSRLSSCLKVPCRVDSGSLIHIHRNTYSVHSRLIGEQVEARLFADRVEIWYADQQVDTLPRLVGRDRQRCTIGTSSTRWCVNRARSRITPTATICSRRRDSAWPTTGSARAATNAAAPRTTSRSCTTRPTTARSPSTTHSACSWRATRPCPSTR